MGELEKRLEALANRGSLQEAGPVIPDWVGSCPIPSQIQSSDPTNFRRQRSPNQHIYYFKSQTENIVSNDAILACLFIGTLKGIAFELFMKPPEGSIKNWDDLEKLLLTSFFEDYSEITMPTLLATK